MRYLFGSFLYVDKYPAQNERFGIYGLSKRKSSLMIFQHFGNMKFAYRKCEFWCRGYYVNTVGKNTKAIQQYIANLLERDNEEDQLSLFDPHNPFMGSK